MLCNHLSKPRPSVHGRSWQCLFVPTLQTYKDSDIDVFTFGTPINTISLATILLHQAMEMKTWVSAPKLFGPKNCVPVHRLHSDLSCFSLYHWSTEYTHAELIPMVYFDKDKEVEKIKLLAQLAHHQVRMKKLRHNTMRQYIAKTGTFDFKIHGCLETRKTFDWPYLRQC